MLLFVLACTEPYAVPDGATTSLWAEALDVWPDPRIRPEPTLSFPTEWHDAIPDDFSLMSALEDLDGYGTSGAVVLRFSAPVDPATLVVHFTGVDDFEVEYTDEGATVLITPLFPLGAASTHEVWIEAGLRDLEGALVVADVALHDALALPMEGLESVPPDAVGATCFRTQSLFDDDSDVLDEIALDPPSLSDRSCQVVGELELCDLTLDALDFLGDDREASTRPDARYDVPVDLYLPTLEGPWPVLIYGHGLGGDRGEAHRVARYLGPLGIAVASIDAPRHGDHPSVTDTADFFWILQFFGIEPSEGGLHVEQLRDNWRGAAWDKVQLAQALRESEDFDEVFYAGHSLGGIMGAQLLALDDDIGAAELRVPGGRVSEIVHRGETFAPLIALMAPSGTSQGEVDRFFPMLQAAIERGDAVNHATRVQRDLLVTLVEDDDIIPNACTEVLSRAYGVEVAPPGWITGLAESPGLPTSGNVDGRTAIAFRYAEHWDDEQETFVPATHGDTFSSATGQTQSEAFWASKLATGRAEVIDPFD